MMGSCHLGGTFGSRAGHRDLGLEVAEIFRALGFRRVTLLGLHGLRLVQSDMIDPNLSREEGEAEDATGPDSCPTVTDLTFPAPRRRRGRL